MNYKRDMGLDERYESHRRRTEEARRRAISYAKQGDISTARHSLRGAQRSLENLRTEIISGDIPKEYMFFVPVIGDNIVSAVRYIEERASTLGVQNEVGDEAQC